MSTITILILASIIFFGVSIGSLWAGVQSAKIGRKKSLMIGLFLMLTGNIVIGFSQSFALLMVGRVLNGLAAGCEYSHLFIYALSGKIIKHMRSDNYLFISNIT